MLSTEGPKIVVADVTGDGLEDFFIGSAKHDTSKIFIQTPSGKFTMLRQVAFAVDREYEDAGAEFFDADNDGDQDLIVASGGNLDRIGSELLQPRLYINNGKGYFKRDKTMLPALSLNASCVRTCDFDNDGLKDVFIGGRSIPGEYGTSPQSYLLKNIKGVFRDVTGTLAPRLRNIGMVTDAVWEDVDNDAKQDLLLVGEWMPLTIFKNTGEKLGLSNLNNQFSKTSGWWNCIKSADLDNDGDTDFVIGNLGLNSKIKADEDHPAQLHVNDFDKNGTRECVLSYYKADGKLYPYYLRNDIVAQLPYLKKRFLKHGDYAGKTTDEVFEEDQLNSSLVKKAYRFETSVIINRGKGRFSLQSLPPRAQLSPVYAILVNDYDKDGFKDILLGGNLFELKPELGRYDADYGTFLKGSPHNKYTYFPSVTTGFFYRGQARDIVNIKSVSGESFTLLSRNNNSLVVYKNKL
jgi:hypothetical protein